MKVNTTLQNCYTSFSDGMVKGYAHLKTTTDETFEKARKKINTVADRIKLIAKNALNSLVKLYDRISNCFIIERLTRTFVKQQTTTTTSDKKPVKILQGSIETTEVDFTCLKETHAAAKAVVEAMEQIATTTDQFPDRNSIWTFSNTLLAYFKAIENIPESHTSNTKSRLYALKAFCKNSGLSPKVRSKEKNLEAMQMILENGWFFSTLEEMNLRLNSESTQA